jgi:hypothetical protein
MYLVFNVFYFYSGVGQKDSGMGRADLPPPPLCYALELKLKEMDGVEILQHPAYSPDVAPSDYGLFQAWSIFFEGKIWKYRVEIECRNFFASKNNDWYRDQIRKLLDQWGIESDGLLINYSINLYKFKS